MIKVGKIYFAKSGKTDFESVLALALFEILIREEREGSDG